MLGNETRFARTLDGKKKKKGKKAHTNFNQPLTGKPFVLYMQIRKELLTLVSAMSNSLRAIALIWGMEGVRRQQNRSKGAKCDRVEKQAYGLNTIATPGGDLLIIIVVLLGFLLGGIPLGRTTFALLSRAVIGAIVFKVLVFRGGNLVVRHLCEKEPRMNPMLRRR